MIVITFSNPKGGTGKTTATLVLAEQIAVRGGRVSILDCDPNRNLVRWAAEREEQGRGVPYRIAKRVEDPGQFMDQIEDEEPHADYLLIDLEGAADQFSTFATQQADLVLVPMALNYMEATQAERAVQLVRTSARSARRTIHTKLLLNRTSGAVQGADETELRKILVGAGAQLLPVELKSRRAYNAMFKDAATLDEIRADIDAATKSATVSARERKLKPIEGAIENARAYANAVLADVETMLNAA